MTSAAAQALFVAIQTGDAEGVAQQVRADPGLLRALSPMGVPPLLFAAYYRKEDVARVLLALHAEYGPPLTPFEAAATGEVTALRRWLDQGGSVDVNATSPDGFSALGLAAFFGREEVAAELLAHGADVNAVSANAMRVQPLHSAVAGHHTALVRRLVQAGADVNAAQQDGFTPLMAAAQNGQAEMVALLLEAGAQPQAQTMDGRTALSMAQEEAQTQQAEVVALLSGGRWTTGAGQPQESRKAAAATGGHTGSMTHHDDPPRDAQQRQEAGHERIHEDGRPADGTTGFQTTDPKDDHQQIYTTTPAADRVGSSDEGKYEPVQMQDPHEITAQFDHLATRDPAAMEHALQTPEFAGAETVAGLGVEALDDIVPSAGLGLNTSIATAQESQRYSADPNPAYTPPSELGPPHLGERPGDLPPGTSAELESEVEGESRR